MVNIAKSGSLYSDIFKSSGVAMEYNIDISHFFRG